MKYSVDMIIVNKWAEFQQMPNEKWKQTWEIVLKNSIAETIDVEDISKELSQEDFNVHIKVNE